MTIRKIVAGIDLGYGPMEGKLRMFAECDDEITEVILEPDKGDETDPEKLLEEMSVPLIKAHIELCSAC